jgi:oligopeptide/dipeptide ABC transporter ATP-binding protein
MADTFLSVRDLRKMFPIRAMSGDRGQKAISQLVAIDGVSFDVARSSTLGIVGESGSGKTTLARCLVRLQEPTHASIVLDGIDVMAAKGSDLREVRRRMQLVFQDPYTSLSPRLSVGAALIEAARVHGRVDKGESRGFVDQLLDTVGLPPAIAGRRPKELSGGQRQRVAIARALAVSPDLLIADEATSSLDVSIQAQILNLFRELKDRLGLTMIFISHQLSVVSYMADYVAIMYLGRLVEYGSIATIFENPQHPYTKALLAAHPDPESPRRHEAAIQGDIPSPLAIPSGCRFRTRCPFAQPVCEERDPTLEQSGPSSSVACHIRPFA